tara:strand:- start:4040 stop:4909 length:870 start_codon:yes stop_codon:yes gene_type:complete
MSDVENKKLDGTKLSRKIKEDLKLKISKLEKKPGLGIILVGSRPDSQVYVNMKIRACKYVGIENYDIHLNESVSEDIIISEIEKMNHDDKINAILVQLPLPKHIDEKKVLNKVSYNKDVDGFHNINIGKLTQNDTDYISPCTPLGCIKLLNEYNIVINGKKVVILGRSNIVGLPLSLLLLHHNATVTICHSRTKDLFYHTKNADILVAAIGKPNFIKSEHIKENCIIIDIGINKIDADNDKGYKLVGDVDYQDVYNKVDKITPVPGGVGPMTIAMLLQQTYNLYKKKNL